MGGATTTMTVTTNGQGHDDNRNNADYGDDDADSANDGASDW